MSDLEGRKIKPGGLVDSRADDQALCVPASVAVGEIMRCTGIIGNYMQVGRADATTLFAGGRHHSRLYAAKSPGTSNKMMLISDKSLITMNTTGSVIGDPVYLSETPGQLTLLPVGNVRQVGIVIGVGGAGVGKVHFDGAPSGPAIVSGTVVLDNDDAVIILPEALGGAYHECPVIALLESPSGSVHVLAAGVSGGGELTITLSGLYSGGVHYAIFVR